MSRKLRTAIVIVGFALAAIIGVGVSSATAQAVGVSSATAHAVAVPVSPTPAAVNCNWDPSRGTTGVSIVNTKSIRLRYGPAARCDYIGDWDMPVPTQLWAKCQFRNPDSGNIWYYVDPNDTTWRNGWIYAGNVKVGWGTIPTC